MSLPLERWAKQAVELEKNLQFDPVPDGRILQDLQEFARLQRLTWKRRQEEIIRPTWKRVAGGMLLDAPATAMPETTFGGLLAYPPAGTVTTTSLNGTVNLWPQAIYSPLNANAFLTPQAYRIALIAKITTSTAPGNLGFDPRLGQGTWTTGGTAITGTTMGATGNVALTASITNAFYYIIGDMTIRSIGAPGANAVVVGMFHAVSTQNTAAGLAGPAATSAPFNLLFGGTQVSFDFTVNQGLGFGAVHTVATITHNIEQIHFMDWN